MTSLVEVLAYNYLQMLGIIMNFINSNYIT